MKTTIQERMLGMRMSLALARARYLGAPSRRLHISSSEDESQSIKKLKLGAKMSETVKGKLSLGAKILRVGGLRKIYKKLFSMSEGEKLLKVSQCYLSTTAGPLVGLLFISTHNIAFCSDKSIKLSSPNGDDDYVRFDYKVVIPKEKVMRVDGGENVKKASEKYIQIVTVDNFEFWFMGFLNYQSTFNSLLGVDRRSL